MSEGPTLRLLLIVTGSTLRAEQMDRPLAYYLKQRIEEAIKAAPGDGLAGYQVAVIADFRWIHDESLQDSPTITVGGPGVNELTHRWLEEVPLALAFSERYFIQLDPDQEDAQASIWGMDNSTTQIAVAVFLDRFLPQFLERCAAIAPNSPDADDESESELDSDEE